MNNQRAISESSSSNLMNIRSSDNSREINLTNGIN